MWYRTHVQVLFPVLIGHSLVEVTRTKGLDLSPQGSQDSEGQTGISPGHGPHWSQSGGRVTVTKPGPSIWGSVWWKDTGT